MASPAPPMPPDVAQQASPQGAQAAMSAQGVGTPQPEMAAIQQAMQMIQGLEQPFDGLVSILRQTHPPLIATLQPMAQALVTLRKQLQDLAKRSGAAMGSPIMPVPGPPTPGGAPPNPAEQ